MNRNGLIVIGLLLTFAVILFNYKTQLKSEVNEKITTLGETERDGVLLNDLRNRWDNKKSDEKLIRYLKSFSPAPKVKSKGNKITFSFEPMDKSRFETLSKKILQSTIQISRFEVERVDDYTLNFMLEVDK